MKLSRLPLLTGITAALLLGAMTMFTSNAALAEQDPITTTGTVGGGSGNASVFNIADLKADAPSGPNNNIPGGLQCWGQPLTCNYDDDTSNNSHFVVTPNLDDSPLQWANKYVFINNPSGVLEVQKTIYATTTAGANGQIVYDDLQPGSAIATNVTCTTLLGSNTTAGDVANGLITTGQKSATELLDIRNGCQQNTVGVLVNPFPVSKHLPPGVYNQCIILAQNGGATTPAACSYFTILPITGYTTDLDIVDYGNLTQFVKSIFGGNFTLDNNGNNINPGTIQGTGNTSPKLLVAFSRMVNQMGTPSVTGDDKYINSYFDVQINRRDTTGAIIATQHVDNILGGTPFGPDADLTTGTSTGSLPYTPICLEPNELLKLDFSVTPQDVLYAGTYTGQVRLTVTNAGPLPPNCTPTLANNGSESGLGDSDSTNNNLPGTPVGQNPPSGASQL